MRRQQPAWRRGAFCLLMLVVILPRLAVAQDGGRGLPDPRLREVMPEATRFGPFQGEPPAADAFRDGERIGYVFLTREVVNSTGYSGKPLDILVGLGLDGRLTGARIVEQHEPILTIGVTEEDLHAFVAQYHGLDIREPIDVVRSGPGDVDAVSGATISSTVMNDAILRAAREVARTRGLFGDVGGGLVIASDQRVDWESLRDEGALERLEVKVGEANKALAERGAELFPPGVPEREPDSLLAELVFGLVSPERIGASLLGEELYARYMAALRAGDHALLIVGNGTYSFKGTAWRQEGVFDRLQLVQGERTLRFAEDQHQRVDRLEAAGVPEFRELALFRLPQDSGFEPTSPFRLELIVHGAGGGLASFGASYQIPQRYVIAPTAIPEQGMPLWQQVWQRRTLDIAILGGALVILTGIFVFQEILVRRRRLHFWLRAGFLTFTLFWVGWYATAQLSILNVLTFGDALRTGFRWDFFLLDPLMFILWSYVAVALLFWGRGVFCGWLCPFGALQELTNQIGRRLRMPQLRVPFALHERIWMIKYVIFLALFALSLGPTALAVQFAEVEPFKTAIVLRFDRAWPFVLYASALLTLGLFVERAFCRYLCPLGAALAIPAKIRLFEWLKRHRQCGAPCQICATECPVQAIHPAGQINPNECITCLHCQVNYHDAFVCPPMIERRTRRERREALVRRAET